MPNKVFQGKKLVPDPYQLLLRWRAGLQGEISAEQVRAQI